MVIFDDLAELDGCTDPSTYPLLAELAAQVPEGEAIVEIGTYRGKSACYLASGAQSGGGAHVWTVDPHDLPGERYPTSAHPNRSLNYSDPRIRQAAERQIRQSGLSEHITMVRAFSTDTAEEWSGPEIGLLFIDGDHRQPAVRLDYRSWQPHLSRNALIVFDDHSDSHPGVPAAVAGLVHQGVLEIVNRVGRVVVCREVRQ